METIEVPVELTSALIRSRLADCDARIAMLASKKADVEKELSFRRGGVLLGTSDADVTRLTSALAAIVAELGTLTSQRADLAQWEPVAVYRDLKAADAARVAQHIADRATWAAEHAALTALRKEIDDKTKDYNRRDNEQSGLHRRITWMTGASESDETRRYREQHEAVLRDAGVL